MERAFTPSCKYQGQDFLAITNISRVLDTPACATKHTTSQDKPALKSHGICSHEFSPLTANDWHVSLRLRLADSELTASPVTHPSLLHEAPLVVSSSNLIKAPDVSRVNACMCVHQESA